MSEPTQLTTEQFLDAAVAAGASSRLDLTWRLRAETDMEYPRAEQCVREYCDAKAPGLPIQCEIRGCGRDDFIACLLVPAIFALLGSIIWLVYRTLTTAPKPSDSPNAFPETPTSIGFSVLLVGWLVWSLVRGKARQNWWVFRRITFRVIGESVLALLTTVLVAYALVTAFPFLNRSWLYLLPSSNGHAINIGLIPVEIRFLAPLFIIVFALCIPWLAHGEEEQYRKGTRDWKHAARRSLRFGLAHCVWAGVPIHFGLALSVAGMWFTRQYFRGGVERSTIYHATYNLIVVTVLALALILG